MSDLLPPALALNPEESLHEEELDHIKKQLDDVHRRVGTSFFIEKILPKLLPRINFSYDRGGYHKKQTTMSDLVPALSAVLKEKALVDAKEELADLYKRVDAATSIEIVHEAKNTEDDTVAYASGTFEDGDFKKEMHEEQYWNVPLNSNKRPTTCKLKDLRECRVCVGGGFTNRNMKLDPRLPRFFMSNKSLMSKNDGKIEYSLFFEDRVGMAFMMGIKFTIDGWPKEEQESLFNNYNLGDDFFRVTATVAQNYPEATVRFTLARFGEGDDIQGPLRRVPEASSRSSLSQPKRPSKSLLDIKEELNGLYRRLETATSIEVMRVNFYGDIVVYASGKFENGHFDDYPWENDNLANGGWVVSLNNGKMPTCKLKDLVGPWEFYLCVGGGFKYQKLIGGNSNSTGFVVENDGKIECSIWFADSSLEFTMTIDDWPTEATEEDTWKLKRALTPPMNREDRNFFWKTVAENYPEATVRFDLVSFHAKTIKRPLKRLLSKHRRQKLREEVKELALEKGYDEYLALAEKL